MSRFSRRTLLAGTAGAAALPGAQAAVQPDRQTESDPYRRGYVGHALARLLRRAARANARTWTAGGAFGDVYRCLSGGTADDTVPALGLYRAANLPLARWFCSPTTR